MTTLFNSILADPAFSAVDKEWLLKFNAEVHRRIETHGVNFGITMFSIADTIGMDLTAVHKEGPFMFAMWVILLHHFQPHLKLEDMKYPTFEHFLQAYVGWFSNESDAELQKLWQVANWMNILFKMITARKNKGLAMQVVPKLIEGWEVKYVTGSGQTRFTANRVHIFEVEGNVKANHRSKGGKSGSKRGRGGEGRRPSQPTKKELAIPKRRRRGTRNQKQQRDDSMSEGDENGLVYVYNQQGEDGSDNYDDDDDDDDEEGDDDSSVNEEIKEVFQAFVLDRDETGEVEMELIRDISNMRFDNGEMVTSPTVPTKQRQVTWTEIVTDPALAVPVEAAAIPIPLSEVVTYPSYHSSANNSYTSSNMAEFAPQALPGSMLNDIFSGYGYSVNISE